MDFYQNEDKNIPVRIYDSPPFEVSVGWYLADENGTLIEEGNITFPANALANRNIKFFKLTSLVVSSRYVGYRD